MVTQTSHMSQIAHTRSIGHFPCLPACNSQWPQRSPGKPVGVDFTGQKSFLISNQQYQCTEGNDDECKSM